MSRKEVAQAITFNTSYIIFSITFLVLFCTICYIYVAAHLLTVKKTFIEPMFILILFFLLLSISGFIMYNRAGDLIADNARLCPSCSND